MSRFLRGRLSPAILTVEDGPEPTTKIQEALIENAFNFSNEELENIHVGEIRSGWLNGANGDASFEDINLWNVGGGTQVNHLIFRLAEKKVKPAEVKRRLKEACENWKKENELGRVPRTVKEDLKNNILLELESRTLASIRDVEVVWYQDGVSGRHEVVICAQADWAINAVRKAMFNHFNLNTQILTIEKLLGENKSAHLMRNGEVDFMQNCMNIFWVDEEIKLKSGKIRAHGKTTLEGDNGKTVIKALDNLPNEEINAAIKEGNKNFTSIGFELNVDENIYTGELCQPLSIRGVALPRVEEGETGDYAGSLVLRLDLLQTLMNSIKEFLVDMDEILAKNY